MHCTWKHNPPGITTVEQASETLFTLKQLQELEQGVDKKYDAKVEKLKADRAGEKVLEFDDVAAPVPFDSYRGTLRERLTEFALNRMDEKTLRVEDAGQLARRTNTDQVTLTGGKEQLTEVQDLLNDRLVTLLKSASLADLLSDEARKKLGKDELKKLASTPLMGLYRLKVEADPDTIKAQLKSGALKPTDLPPLGYTWTQGTERVDITIK